MTKNKRPAVAPTTAGAVNVASNERPPFTNNRRPKHALQLRAQLAHLRARYDAGAVAPAVYAVIRELETDIAWAEEQTS